MNCRTKVVEDLVAASNDGMVAVIKASEASAEEVISAHLTNTLRCVQVAREMGWNMDALRDGVVKIWAELPPVVVS